MFLIDFQKVIKYTSIKYIEVTPKLLGRLKKIFYHYYRVTCYNSFFNLRVNENTIASKSEI